MMIVLFSIYMIVWPILFVFCMDCIYQVVQDILKEVREINKLRARQVLGEGEGQQ